MSRWILLFVLFSSVAEAYIPPSWFQIKKLADKKSHLDKVVILSSVNTIVNQSESSGVFFEKLLVDYKKGQLQSLILNSDQEILFSTVYSFNVSQADENLEKSVPFQRLKNGTQAMASLLLVLPNDQDILPVLVSKKIPIQTEGELATMVTQEEKTMNEKVFIKRLDRQPAWVIGKRSEEEKSGEIWIEKDSFLVKQIIWPQAKSDEIEKMIFNEYKAFNDFIYPKETLYLQGEQPRLRVIATQVDTRPDKIQWVPSSKEGWTERGKGLTDEVKEAIHDFYRVIR